MAFKIKDNLDLSGFTINRFCIDAQAELPNTGTIGAGRKLFYTGAGDFNNHELVYDGTSFRALAFLDEIANNENFTELIDRVAAVEGKFTGSKAKDADKLDGNDSSYFATASALNYLSTKVNAFFDGTVDVDNVIDNLKDIQDFLDNYSDVTNLSSILATKADKATTLEGYGITNAYTKTQADDLFLTTEDVVNTGNTLSFGSAIIIGSVGGTNLTAALPSVESVKTSLGLKALAYQDSVSKADVGLGNVENVALSTWKGSVNITTVGTITSGTWQGSKIANDYLANSAITIAGTSVPLGGSITAATITAAQIGSGNTLIHSGNIGNQSVASAIKLADDTAFTAWGQTFFENGKPKNVSGALSGVTNINSALYISSSGNVGIGATDPKYNLDVKGRASVGDELYLQNASYSTSGEGSFLIRLYNGNLQFSTRTTDGALKSYPLIINYNTNKATFNGDLHVTGNIIADGEVSAGGASEEGSAGSGSGASIYATSIAKSQTSVTINHGLNTRDVVISIYEKDSESTSEVWNMILTDIEIVDANNVQVTFGSATTVEHKVVIFGAA